MSHRVLLDSARARLQDGHTNEAIVIAQTAAELFAEETFNLLYERRGIADLKRVIGRLLYENYNLAHDRVASLYEGLSGDQIKQRPFWSRYKDHNELRNDIVHDGRIATPEEAEASLGVVEELIAHLERATSVS